MPGSGESRLGSGLIRGGLRFWGGWILGRETPFRRPFPAWTSFFPPSRRCPIPGQTTRVTTCANCLRWPSSRCSAGRPVAPGWRTSAGQRSMFSGASSNSSTRSPRMTPIPTVLRMIDPKALDAAFGRVLAGIAALLGDGDVIAIDGKALRGARDKAQTGRAKAREPG